jgi:folate-binding protein YgfZ
MATTSTSSPDYRAATESVAIYPVPNPGYLLISGGTRREYIQRQTAPTGRILEYYVLLEHGDSVAMLTQPGHGPGNAMYFQKRIFFNDNVTIHDRSSKWAQIELLGPKAPNLLMGLGFSHPPGLEEILECDWQGVELRAFGVMGFGPIDRFRLLAPSSQLNQVTKELSNCPTLSFSSREILRIEASHAGDPEFSAETTPFELGMDSVVSTTKGCYTGQEVLARQVTYDKVVRRLVMLQSISQIPAGTELQAEGKVVGKVTSSAISPKLGPIALAVVRKPYDEVGTKFTANVLGQLVNSTVSNQMV